MSAKERKFDETVDITALSDEELEDVVGGADGVTVPNKKEPK